MIYNLRSDRVQRPEIIRRLRDEHLLSEGWGGGTLHELPMTRADFVQAAKTAYGLKSTRLATNLSRIAQFRDGDLIVTPHLPADGTASIHVVDGDFPACYDYLVGDQTHLNHRVRVRESAGLAGNVSMRNVALGAWYSKLPWLRLPILAIPEFDEIFQQLLRDLRASPSRVWGVSPLTEFLDALAAKVERLVHDELGKMPPSAGDCSFEALCVHLLSSQGYTITRRHTYDSAGGDVDITCERNRGDASPFEQGQVDLYVQVKRHFGTTNQDGVAQLLQMMEKDGADGCVITLADAYDQAAQELARNNAIRLIDGYELSRLVLQHVVARPLVRPDV